MSDQKKPVKNVMSIDDIPVPSSMTSIDGKMVGEEGEGEQEVVAGGPPGVGGPGVEGEEVPVIEYQLDDEGPETPDNVAGDKPAGPKDPPNPPKQ